MDFNQIYVPDEILVMILEVSLTETSLQTSKSLLFVNKKISQIVIELMCKLSGQFSKSENIVSSLYIKDEKSIEIDLPSSQIELICGLKKWNIYKISYIPGFFLHGVCIGIIWETAENWAMTFNCGKLILHTVSTKKSSGLLSLYLCKKVEFHPNLRFERFDQEGKTIRIVTCSFAKFLFDEKLVYISKKKDPESYENLLASEMKEYSHIERWLAEYEKRTVE